MAVLNFMYQGEVNVAQEELNSFLAVAEELKVKGENIIFIIKKTAKIPGVSDLNCAFLWYGANSFAESPSLFD